MDLLFGFSQSVDLFCWCRWIVLELGICKASVDNLSVGLSEFKLQVIF